MAKIRLPCDVIFKKGTVLNVAPSKTERFGVHYDAIKAIGKDNIAILNLSSEDLDALKQKKK